MTRIALVTGAQSQLARCMRMAGAPPGWRAAFLAREELDIADPSQVQSALDKTAPDCIVNTAAYTAVDKAESEPDQARRVNADAVANLARWCEANDSRLIHISTDFVFDGSATAPYLPEDEPAPLGEYGLSKLAGEREVGKLPAGQGVVVRASWLYSEFGRNFVKTMLSLMAERDELAVVNDQSGCPTSAHTLAALIWRMVLLPARSGLYHWHDGGVMSWYEFALEIQKWGQAAGVLQSVIPIRPIASAEYPAAATRPAYSVMDRSRTMADFDMPERDWRSDLVRVVGAIAELGGPR
ncbi:MAG: dTDP-4-dehydrorhamnose reductase [Gammaproteobacteria bacterium]|nr:dTDP-4-dehydrorhamnose reductase [Gammaproteobacteria bacterium]MYA67508.1 dTDP-4-dehydrorhamnose reductase [Gammaproteobacteria bacterium]MYG95411.1 dTDP-4-dehydrorhamnose reductase [Gammaproteobacteria bacterium]MYH47800.1 dTDP-4-dehydrorhamnose reductase [Gammaproteobacteria bacterium]MYL13476.1 dTDP-4-dehydrorhamnose reductase [Gammaproteobacteria bacterium]